MIDPSRKQLVLAAVALIVALGCGLAVYEFVKSTGPDVDAARATGTAIGKRAGAKAGRRSGYEDGMRSARTEAYRDAFSNSFKLAYLAEFKKTGLTVPETVSVPEGAATP